MLKKQFVEQLKSLVSDLSLNELLANPELIEKLTVLARMTGDLSILERYRGLSDEVLERHGVRGAV